MIPRLDQTTLAGLPRACADVGAFVLQLDEATAAIARAALTHARAFFALPAAAKHAVAIASSPHHRGFSEMHNERDWREQLHLGRDRAAVDDAGRPWQMLSGPNRWPAALGDDFVTAISTHQEAMAALGRRILGALDVDTPVGDAYLVTKLICYHPQPQGVVRSGVAAHVDYSLVTLLLQDEVGGLELMTRAGEWWAVPPVADAILVNLGELTEAATGGRLRATPHRVTNQARDRSRISIPVFVNPPLDSVVPVAPAPARAIDVPHIHRVLPADGASGPFHYGRAEWRRKGLNVWCERRCAAQ